MSDKHRIAVVSGFQGSPSVGLYADTYEEFSALAEDVYGPFHQEFLDAAFGQLKDQVVGNPDSPAAEAAVRSVGGQSNRGQSSRPASRQSSGGGSKSIPNGWVLINAGFEDRADAKAMGARFYGSDYGKSGWYAEHGSDAYNHYGEKA